MNSRLFDRKLSALALYKHQSVPNTMYPLVQLRLKNFKDLNLDPTSVAYKVKAGEIASTMLEHFHALYVETHNNEMSILLPNKYTQYNRSIERMNSLFTSKLVSVVSREVNWDVEVETSIYALPNEDIAVDYFRWRQANAFKWSMRENVKCVMIDSSGLTEENANMAVSHLNYNDMKLILHQFNIDHQNNGPLWVKRGIGVYYVERNYLSKNPIDNSDIAVLGREPFINFQLPSKDRYARLLLDIISTQLN